MHGKVHSQSDTWFMERYGTKFTGRRIHPRDYSLKPQSAAILSPNTKKAGFNPLFLYPLASNL